MDRSIFCFSSFARGPIVVLIFLVLLYTTPALTQDWEVWGRGDGLTLDQDEDDGLNGEAEISLSIQWSHLDAERNKFTSEVTTMSTGHNWDVSGSTLSGLAQNMMTQECDESDYIFVTARLNESDMLNSFENVLATVAGIAVGITVATILAPTGPGAAAGGALAAKVAGGIVGALAGSFLKSFGGVEDLGQIKAKKLQVGANDFQLNGPDGSGMIRIEDLSFQTGDFILNCVEGLRGNPPQDPVDPDTAVNGIFPDALSVLALVPTLNREDHNGPEADTEIRYLRRSVTETVTSLAEVAAAYFVYQAQTGFLGASDALPLLASGRIHHAAGNSELAVADYREAFRIAYTAIWDGNLGSAYIPASHLTLLGSTRMVSGESHHDFFGWAQGLGATEFIDFVDVEGQESGMEFFVLPGVARTAVVLVGDLPPDFEQDSLLGLGRISAGVVNGPDGGCAVSHLEEASIGFGIFIDGQGPFFEPDPTGCGYGEVIETYMDLWGGGVPLGASPDPDAIFTLALDLSDELLPGEYQLTVTAFIEDTGGGAGREISAPLTLLVAAPGALFTDGFESGDLLEWSTNVP